MNRLRRTFIAIASGAVLIVLSLVLLSLYAVNTVSNYNEIYSITDFILENSGRMPHIDLRKETVTDFYVYNELQYETRYFSLITDLSGNILSSNFDHIASVDDDDIDNLMSKITSEEAMSVFMRIFNDPRERGIVLSPESDFAYRRKELDQFQLREKLLSETFYRGISDDISEIPEDGGYIIVFLDCSRRILDMRSLRISSLIIGAVSFLIFFLIITAYSKRAIQPYIDNHEKQKRFITNAGHELKTPLTIISANMEVLELIEGRNEWTESTINQVKRLTGLVNDLITMARTEEYMTENEKLTDTLDVSKTVKELADSFRPVAEKEFKRIETEIDENITITCDSKRLSELFSILIDNAVKYSSPDSVIKIRLCKKGDSVEFSVNNRGNVIGEDELEHIFDRFYRAEKSRTTKGYGLGLSIAQKIVQSMNGRLTAKSNEQDGTTFTAVFK